MCDTLFDTRIYAPWAQVPDTTSTAEELAAQVADQLFATGFFPSVTRVASTVTAVSDNGLESGTATVVVTSDRTATLTATFASAVGNRCTETEPPMAYANTFYLGLKAVFPGVTPGPPAWSPPFFDGCNQVPAVVASGVAVTCTSPKPVAPHTVLCAAGFNCNNFVSVVVSPTLSRTSNTRPDGAVGTMTIVKDGSCVHAIFTVAVPNIEDRTTLKFAPFQAAMTSALCCGTTLPCCECPPEKPCPIRPVRVCDKPAKTCLSRCG